MDIDDLRRDFQRYKEEGGLEGRDVSILPSGDFPLPGGLKEVFAESFREDDEPQEGEDGPGLPEGIVVFRPGMTMEQMEEEAIRAVLKEVGGNRRMAAEQLEIGERTLYRKIKKYGLEE